MKCFLCSDSTEDGPGDGGSGDGGVSGGGPDGGTSSDGGTVTTVNLVITIPASCATTLGGCSGVQTVFQQAFSGGTCAAAAASACDCSATINRTIRDTTTYTKAGSQITVANGDTYDFCVSASKMTYTQTGSNAPSGVFEMTKR